MGSPRDEIAEQVEGIRASLLSMGSVHCAGLVGRALDLLAMARDGREPTLGEIVQAAGMLALAAELKLLEG